MTNLQVFLQLDQLPLICRFLLRTERICSIPESLNLKKNDDVTFSTNTKDFHSCNKTKTTCADYCHAKQYLVYKQEVYILNKSKGWDIIIAFFYVLHVHLETTTIRSPNKHNQKNIYKFKKKINQEAN